MIAERATGRLGGFGNPDPSPAAPPDYTVVPVDLDGPDRQKGRIASTFVYSSASDCSDSTANPFASPPPCALETDVLSGFGGLNRLATQGVVFPRVYSTSGRCGPARGTLLSGRYVSRIDIVDNGLPLKTDEVTIAEFLKAPCADPLDPNSAAYGTMSAGGTAQCYTTGQVGKWHLGHRSSRGWAPWQQGFDEVIGFKGGGRRYQSFNALTCSPQGFFCTTDPVTYATESACTASEAEGGCTEDCVAYPDGSTIKWACYNANPTATCESQSDPTKPDDSRCVQGTCRAWGQYLGPEKYTACHPTIASTHPQCCTATPDTKLKKGTYDFKKDGYKLDGNTLIWQTDNSDPANPTFPCNDDGPTTRTGCNYLTRHLRDYANDFVVRHATDADPFFLYVAFHATHSKHQAPYRTRAHYRTLDGLKPRKPAGGSDRYWAILEELDAAIGSVVRTLTSTGVCAHNSLVPCTADAQCDSGGGCRMIGKCSGDGVECLVDGDCDSDPPGQTCQPLIENTLVIFTNDQGSPSTGYGVPMLRAGKQTVFEGGALVGGLVWAPGLGIGTFDSTDPDPVGLVQNYLLASDADHAPLASLVDFYPTILEAAGYVADADGRATNLPGGVFVDGRSMIPALTGGVGTRDFVFDDYHGDGSMVVARQGYYVDRCSGGGCPYADKVCAYEGYYTGTGTTDKRGRKIRGASCTPCTSDDQCTGTKACTIDADCADGLSCSGGTCEAVQCEILGGVCIDPDPQGADYKCTELFGLGISTTTGNPQPHSEDPDSGCDIKALPRCRGVEDCASGLICEPVRLACNKCVSASWKLRGKMSNDELVPTALFELTSNPEEEERRLKFKPDDPDGGTDDTLYAHDGRLNCLDKDVVGGPIAGSKVLAVFDDLYCRLESLERCSRLELSGLSPLSKINDPRYDCEDPDSANKDLPPGGKTYSVNPTTQQCERSAPYF